MQSMNSPVSSSEDVDYDECVVVVEENADVFSLPDADKSSIAVLKPNKGSGRVSKKNRSKNQSVKDRKCSCPLILKWLEENYEMVPGACLPRSVLYTHYQDFCKRELVEPSSAASFGKIIRMKFPNLSTRRLGTRGQSKYHYYGLAIKESSIYFRSIYSKQGLTRFSGATLKRENSQFYNPTSKTGVLLPEFPKISELNFSKPFLSDKLETFLIMYRAHSQRILDSVVRVHFRDIRDFLMHFWQGMPLHIIPILDSQATVDVVILCDFILYKSLCEVLVPANLQQIPDNLVEEVISFSHNLVEWLFGALQDVPASLGVRKLQGVEMFGKSLRRQIALLQLAKDARGVLRNSESISCILKDWRSIDFVADISSQGVLSNQYSEQTMELFKEFYCELEQLMVKQSSLDIYFEWMDSVIERNVCEPADKGHCSLLELSQDFVAVWSNFYLVVEKEIILLKGQSLDFYRLLHLVLNEYLHHVIELLQARVIESQYKNILRGTMTLNPMSSNSEEDFIHHFENKMAQEFPDSHLFSSYSSFQSAGFASGMSDPLYNGFFDGEQGDTLYKQQQCSLHPTSLPIDGVSPHAFESTPTPLTPQSSLCSSGSPLSHVSIQSPQEMVSITPDMTDSSNNPISQVNMYNLDSSLSHLPPPPALMHIFPNNGPSICSTDSSACTSPLQHIPLDLVAGPNQTAACGSTGNANPYTPASTYSTPVGPMPPLLSPQELGDHYSHHHNLLPPYGQTLSPGIMVEPGYPTPHNMIGNPHYDFELHHYMSDPNVFLTKCICKVEDSKPSVSAMAQCPTAII